MRHTCCWGREEAHIRNRNQKYLFNYAWPHLIPCLPIHDSFIVPEEHEKMLYDVMVEAYQEVDYYGFSPIIKKVE